MLYEFNGLSDQYQPEFPHGPGDCARSEAPAETKPNDAAESPELEALGDDWRTVGEVFDERAEYFKISNLRQAQFKTVARDRRDDPTFSWRKLGYLSANEKRQFHPGRYQVEGLRGVQGWTGASVASILYHGKNPIFDDDEEAPRWIVDEIKAGIADAPPDEKHHPMTGQDFAKALGVTAADRERHKVWLIGANDRTQSELHADAKARREQRRADKRRDAGMTPRAESTAAEARRLGIKPATAQARLRRWRRQREMAAREEAAAALAAMTIKESKPWEREGIGRSTWFARKANAKAAKAVKAANGQGAVGLANGQVGLDAVAFLVPANRDGFFPSRLVIGDTKKATNRVQRRG